VDDGGGALNTIQTKLSLEAATHHGKSWRKAKYIFVQLGFSVIN
jgi:hypothetical protein